MGVRRLLAVGILLAGVLLAGGTCVFALDPSLDISQYAHTAWKIRNGFTKGRILSIAQTPDGYLWLGTEFGLYRFDGVRAVPWQPPTGQEIPSDFIYSLLVSRDGTLWIGTRNGLASWKGGKVTQYPETAGFVILSLIEDHQGTVWAATDLGGASPAQGKLCAARQGVVQCYGQDVFGRGISFVFEDSTGNLWAGGEGLWKWRPEPRQHYDAPHFAEASEDEHGRLVLAGHEGLRRLVDGKIEKYRLPGVDFPFSPNRPFRSSDGSFWVGTQDRGLVHVHRGRSDWFAQHDGLSGDYIDATFEDREGSIWVSTNQGLDRFRDLAVSNISSDQGLADVDTWAVLATNDGSVWVASASGVSCWKEDKVIIYASAHLAGLSPLQTGRSSVKKAQVISNSGLPDRPQSFFEDSDGEVWVTTKKGIVRWDGARFVPENGLPGDEIYAMAQDSGKSVWVASGTNGLFRVPREGPIEQIPWSRLGHTDYAVAMASDPSQGGLWLGFARGGISYWKDGQVRFSYTSAEGLGRGTVKHLRFGARGSLWAATKSGLSRIKDGRITTLTSKNGLPCDNVHWSVEDDDHSVWLYMACALVRIARSELDAWVADPKHILKTAVYDISDGLRFEPSLGGYGPHVSKSKDGRIWFPGPEGVSVIDPPHLAFNKIPPPVQIEWVIADHKTYDAAPDASGRVSLPPRVRDLQIDYTALSLAAPEKVLFRYKLEGWDRDWQEAGTRRQAYYANLPPRNYRFRVMACNNSGVWNEAGAAMDFGIAPAYWQTWWFRSLCAVLFLGLLLGAYRVRLMQVERQFNVRMEARVAERTRIARDLHDTLLQSFQGALLKFHAVMYKFPEGAKEAQEALERAIEEARGAVTEGRDAVQGLRSSTVVTNDLARAIGLLGDELCSQHRGEGCPEFRVQVEGESRDLPPIIRDDVYRIAAEALRNAFKHAQAGRIEVEIQYHSRQLRVRIRDNGKGVDREILEAGGRAGHYGLGGMQERAKSVGGNLAIWSEADAGTEAELTIPASLAYAKTASAQRAKFWQRGA